MEVTELVPDPERQNLVQAIWEGVAEELRDLQGAGDQEWAQEGAPHLHNAVHKLMEGLWLCSVDTDNTNMEVEGREP